MSTTLKMKPTTTTSKMRNFFLLAGFLVLVTTGSFGQTKATVSVLNTTVKSEIAFDTTLPTAAKTEQTANDSMNFLNWFMGTKQTPTSTNGTNENAANNKAQIIQSGIAPNRILMNTFLKKTIHYNVAVA